jgi:hypothetical protein
MPCVVYRLYDKNGGLLYIGSSINLSQRLRSHQRYEKWGAEIASVRVQPYPNQSKARDEEKAQIWLLNPLHNRMFNDYMPGIVRRRLGIAGSVPPIRRGTSSPRHPGTGGRPPKAGTDAT